MPKSLPALIDVPVPRIADSVIAGKHSLAAGFVQLAVSVILLSSAWPLTKIAIDNGSTPLWFAEGRAVISGVTLVLGPLIMLHAPHGGIGAHPASWLALAYIGLIAGPFGTWCVIEATAALPAVVSSVGFLTTPAVSLILANLLLGEPITADLLAGSALIMFGVGCAVWPRR